MKYLIASNRLFRDCEATTPEELTEFLKVHSDIKRIYFPFWSWKIPPDIVNKYECIGFHASPLPFGRGGSPIQNMIRLGYTDTELCAFRMTDKIDEGKVLLRWAASLDGTLGEIVARMSGLISLMIDSIDVPDFQPVDTGPYEKFGKVPLHFDRIKKNYLPETDTLLELYNEIRMRDEDSHSKAFKYHGKYAIEFTNAKLTEGEVIANVRIFQK